MVQSKLLLVTLRNIIPLQIIHTKSQALQKGKKICETEYSSQFRGTQPPKGPRLRKDFEEKAFVCEMGSLSPLKVIVYCLLDFLNGQQKDKSENLSACLCLLCCASDVLPRWKL